MRLNSGFSALAIAICAMMSSMGAQAGIDLRVVGKIVPGSCNLELDGGGNVDYGKIGSTEVNRAAFTTLSEKTIPFTITCVAPARVAVKSVDNRTDSQLAGITKAISTDYNDTGNFGLGIASEKKIGGYVLVVKPEATTVDGQTVNNISSSDGGGYWDGGSKAAKSILLNKPNSLISWAATSNTPVAITKLSSTLTVQPVLNKGSELNLNSEIVLDGQATLELVYL